MKRRDFLRNSAGLAGAFVPALAFSQAKPCPPAELSLAGGPAAVLSCGTQQAGLPAWIADQPTFKWIRVPTANTASSQEPPVRAPGYTGPSAVVDSWGGIAATPEGDVYLWGGGDYDYSGNEVYRLRLNQASPAWARLNNPSSPVTEDAFYNADGKPTARHTYGGFWVSNGQMKVVGGAYCFGHQLKTSPYVDIFDLTTLTWKTGINSNGGGWAVSGDHATGQIYAVKRNSSSQAEYIRLSPDNSWTVLGKSGYDPGGFIGCAYDSARQRIYRIGSYDQTQRVEYWQVGGGAVDPALTGSASGSFDTAGAYPGVDYDAQNGWILYKPGSGATVLRLNCATLACDTVTTTGETPPTPEYGVCGRFKYVPNLKGFVYVPSWGNAYFLRTA